jgi:hypothetical protein
MQQIRILLLSTLTLFTTAWGQATGAAAPTAAQAQASQQPL